MSNRSRAAPWWHRWLLRRTWYLSVKRTFFLSLSLILTTSKRTYSHRFVKKSDVHFQYQVARKAVRTNELHIGDTSAHLFQPPTHSFPPVPDLISRSAGRRPIDTSVEPCPVLPPPDALNERSAVDPFATLGG